MKVILELPVESVFVFTVPPFLLLLLLEGLFIRLLLRGRRSRRKAQNDDRALQGPTTKELEAVQTRTLPEHRASVTEHTTRAFDPIYTDRTSK